jgi:hypothetical protein
MVWRRWRTLQYPETAIVEREGVHEMGGAQCDDPPLLILRHHQQQGVRLGGLRLSAISGRLGQV